MNFDLTDEQQMLNDSLRRFVTNEYSFEKRSTFIESGNGTDPNTWAALADMGLLAFTFPEAFGGLDGNAVDTMVVMETVSYTHLTLPTICSV